MGQTERQHFVSRYQLVLRVLFLNETFHSSVYGLRVSPKKAVIRLSRAENSLEMLDSGESSYGEERLFRKALIE